MILTLLSWNVNGLRECYDRKYFLPVFRHNPEIVCIQETKASEEKLPEKVRNLYGYHTFFSAVPQGSTAGVGLFSRHNPISVQYGFGNPVLDNKGRVLVLITVVLFCSICHSRLGSNRWEISIIN